MPWSSRVSPQGKKSPFVGLGNGAGKSNAHSNAGPDPVSLGAANANTRSAPDRQLARPERAESSAPEPDTFVLPASAVTASQHMMSCYCVAVEVAVEVQEYARRKDMHIAFTGSDIRAMGITVYIGDNQRLREAS